MSIYVCSTHFYISVLRDTVQAITKSCYVLLAKVNIARSVLRRYTLVTEVSAIRSVLNTTVYSKKIQFYSI